MLWCLVVSWVFSDCPVATWKWCECVFIRCVLSQFTSKCNFLLYIFFSWCICFRESTCFGILNFFFPFKVKVGHCFTARLCFCALTKLRPSFKIIFQYDGNVLSTFNLISDYMPFVTNYVLYQTFSLATILHDCMLRI